MIGFNLNISCDNKVSMVVQMVSCNFFNNKKEKKSMKYAVADASQ